MQPTQTLHNDYDDDNNNNEDAVHLLAACSHVPTFATLHYFMAKTILANISLNSKRHQYQHHYGP